MALPLFILNNRPVELVINDHSIRYIELKSADDLTPIKWDERSLAPGIVKEGKIIDPDTLEIILEECVDEWKIKRRKVRFLVPDPYVTIRKVEIPVDIHIDEIENYLFIEIGESVHLPFEDPVFDFVVLPKTSGKQEILLFAAHREHVEAYTDLLTDVKLKPESADVSALALYRLYHHLNDHLGSENLLIVQFDLDFVNMSVFENEFPLFMRHHYLSYSSTQWQGKTDELGFTQFAFIGEHEELREQIEDSLREIEKMIAFYQFSLKKGQAELSKIVLTGDHPYLASLQNEMQKRFELSVEILKSRQITSENNRPLPAAYHLALGLALKEV
ncbi:pilus assembly protein PilM [Bacillus sp. B15-48]|uniref:type IV pilus biogenesis protein PilM n=1 Tax=Bacillus sp. B15-48 TaxID=1548601 RepID=UPI00193EFAFA|nr:pilus assembly protein PilM [Bacillus sp. B15-48]MBM4762443.1 pilus assembly protein PilM [Bacillus sp. B15-48]